MTTCPPLETVVAWALDEHSPEEAASFEEHYFGCDVCFKRAEHVHRLVAELDASLPALLTTERRRKLETAHGNIPAVRLRPGDRGTLRLGGPTELGLWVMLAPLDDVARVDFEARDLEGGLVFAHRDVPFDAERGEVVLACQVHYRAMPVTAHLRVSVRATYRAGGERVSEYTLDHEFESL